MASEIFKVFGTIGLNGFKEVQTQLEQTDKAAGDYADGLDGASKKASSSTAGMASKVGSGFMQAGNVIGNFVKSSVNGIGSFGQKMQTTGQGMMEFGGIGKTVLVGLGISFAGLGVAIKGGMDRLDALNQANLTFQAFNAAGDKSFGNVKTASEEMTKGTKMSLSDFNQNVAQYVKKGVPEAAAIATTSLNAFVKGTSVGMTDAATATARFNSVGMTLKDSTNTFKDMTKVLAGTGHATKDGLDAASLAISQMAGKGKLDMGNMLQLMNTMPDAMSMLSKSTGMSMGDLQNAISNGKISYADFSKAMSQHASEVDANFAKQGGIMAQTGKTFSGSIANMKNAISRFGATIIQGLGQSKVTDMMANISSSIDDVGKKIAPVIPKVGDFISKVVDLVVKFAPAIAAFLGMSTAIYLVGKSLYSTGGLLNTFSKNPILGMLMLLAMWFAQNYAKSEEFRNKVNTLVKTFTDFVAKFNPVLDGFKDFIKYINSGKTGGDLLKAAVIGVSAGLGTLLAITKIVSLAQAGWGKIVKAGTAIQKAFNSVMEANPYVLLAMAVMAIVGALVYFFTQTKTGRKLWQEFTDFLQNSLKAVGDFFTKAWSDITKGFTSGMSSIGDGWNSFITWIASVPQRIANFFAGIGQWIGQHFTDAVNWIVNAWNGFIAWIAGVPGRVANFFGNIGSWIGQRFDDAKNWATNTFNGLVNWFGGIPSRIANFFSGIGSWIGQHFEDAVRSIRNKFSDLVDFIGSIPSKIANFFRGIHIPLPHFSMSGSGNPIDWIKSGKLPSIGVDWYAKGGIMTGPTVFGMNGNNLNVGGEAGKEAVVPLTKDVLGGIGAGIVKATNIDSSSNKEITVNQYFTEKPTNTVREEQRQARIQFEKQLRVI